MDDLTLTYDFSDSETQAGLSFLIVNARGEELFLGEVHSLMEWIIDPNQDELAEKIDDESWDDERIDVVRLVLLFDGQEIAQLSSEQTRQFLMQLDLLASLQIYEKILEEEGEEEAEEILPGDWN